MTTTLHFHRDAGRRRWSHPWNRAAEVPASHRARLEGLGRPESEPPVDESPDEGKPPLWRRALSLLFTALIIAGTVYLWPAQLGGETRLVIVSGQSMEPTYDLGDIVVARGGGTPEVGDTVVFAVPEGTAEGMLVIHRILELDPEGRFITQGDNRETPDQWPLTEADIVGEPLLHIPKGGVVVRFFQQLWVLAIVLGLLAVFLLWPDESDAESETQSDRESEADAASPNGAAHVVSRQAPGDDTLPMRRPDLTTVANSEVAEVLAVGHWSSTLIDPAAMAEAEDWLDAQLAAALDERTPAAVGR